MLIIFYTDYIYIILKYYLNVIINLSSLLWKKLNLRNLNFDNGYIYCEWDLTYV